MDSVSPTQSHAHKNHHERPLRFFNSPVSYDEHVTSYQEVAGKHESTPIPLTLQDTSESQSACTRPHPVFKRHHEATPSELFYDLFFVANLTAFTAKHEINDWRNLKSYVGFFSLLWATWFNVTLYDLRLARDSVFDRICKAIQFGVLVGFVASGSDFVPNQDGVFESGQLTSLLLMTSRFTLTIQYSLSFWYLRHYHGAWPPMLLTLATTFASGLFYMAISFAFPPYSNNVRAYIPWYCLIFVESAVTVYASSRWRLLSFKGTHIVERLSLLTLIILGEGIIGLADTIHDALDFNLSGEIETTTKSFNAGIVAVILLLYFVYMLYFDSIPEEHFGTIRSQIWAVFHFPLHVALVLFVEGAAQSLRWRRIVQQEDIVDDWFSNVPLYNDVLDGAVGAQNGTAYGFNGSRNTTQYFTGAASQLNSTFMNIYTQLGPSDDVYAQGVQDIGTIANGTQETGLDVLAALDSLYDQSIYLVLKAFGANPEPVDSSSNDFIDDGGDSQDSAALELLQQVVDDNQSYQNLFDLVFKYFFIAGGLTIVLLGILAILGKKSKWNIWDYLRFTSFFIGGLAMALLALVILEDGGTGGSFGQGPWVIPVATIILFVVVVVNHIRS